MPDSDLNQKLQKVASLEEQHELIGVRFAVRDDKKSLITEDVIDCVTSAIEDSVELLAREDQIEVRAPRDV